MKVLLYCKDNCLLKQLSNEIMRFNNNYYFVESYNSMIDLVANGIKRTVFVLYAVINDYNELAFIKSIRSKYPSSIITIIGNYNNEYLIESFRLHIFQYITFPINYKILQEEISRSIIEYNKLNKYKYYKVEQGKIRFDIEEIIYLESYYNSTKIVTINSYYYTNRANYLKIREDVLKHNFVITHAGYVVNMNYINRISEKKLYLSNGSEIPLSYTYSKDFKKRYNYFIKNNI